MTDPVDHVHSLLAVMADPAKHKARLDELVAHQKAVDEKIAAHHEMAADTRRLHTAAQAANIVSDNRKTALDAREADIKRRESELETALAEHKKSAQQISAQIRQREAAASAKETSVLVRENALAAREAALAQAERDAKAIKEKLQRQAAAVKVALTT